MPKPFLFLLATLLALPASAQQMTTAAEVKPILSATKPQWIAVREWEGQDLIYFTNLLAWRCGLEMVTYGVNGLPPVLPLPKEPCYEGEAAPNAIKADKGIEIWVEQPLGSVQSVSVAITYDDGTTDTAEYQRKAVLMP